MYLLCYGITSIQFAQLPIQTRTEQTEKKPLNSYRVSVLNNQFDSILYVSVAGFVIFALFLFLLSRTQCYYER